MTRFLETPRLYLRRFTMADALLLHDLDGDSEVMRFISRGEPTPLEKIEQDILPKWLTWYEVGPDVGYWAAHAQEGNAFLGWFHFRPDRLCANAMELGYRLRREVWGRGFATEGAGAIVQHGFAQASVAHVTATALVNNFASQRVMEKVGLRFESEFTYPAGWLPGWTEEERRAVRYGLKKADYEARP